MRSIAIVPGVVALMFLGCQSILGIDPVAEIIQEGADADAGDIGIEALEPDTIADEGADTSDAGPLTPEQEIAAAERSCAWIAACNRGAGAVDFASCVRSMLRARADVSAKPLVAPAWSCLHEAKSCADVSACTGAATSASACSGAGSGSAKICIGGNVVTCSAMKNVGAQICELAGQTCVTLSTTSAACVASADCPTTSPACKGDRLVQCSGSSDLGSDCAKLGGTCASADAGPGCTTSGAACSSAKCDGDVATYCRFGTEARENCAMRGRVCGGDAGAGCVPSASECNETDVATCSSTDVRYCLGGTTRTVACKSLGLGGCADTFSLSGTSVGCTTP